MVEEVQNQLPQETKDILKSTDSAVHAVADDVRDIGDTLDYSKMTIEQLVKEVRKLRTEHEVFRWEARKVIAAEVERQIKPLVEQLNTFTESKSKAIYIKLNNPFLDFWKRFRLK